MPMWWLVLVVVVTLRVKVVLSMGRFLILTCLAQSMSLGEAQSVMERFLFVKTVVAKCEADAPLPALVTRM